MDGGTGLGGFGDRFLEAAAQHRHWGHEDLSAAVPA